MPELFAGGFHHLPVGPLPTRSALWYPQRLWIYTQDRPFDGGADALYRPVGYLHHNASNYRAEISLPPEFARPGGDS
jgi:hypothetical protein